MPSRKPPRKTARTKAAAPVPAPTPAPTLGKIVWADLTVPDAAPVRDFYVAVAGWSTIAVPMGGYDDYGMGTPGDNPAPVAGVCHARGVNADIPPVWLIYVQVADIARSLREAVRLGGRIVRPATDMGSYGTMAVIRDPAGAHAALIQPPAPETPAPRRRAAKPARPAKAPSARGRKTRRPAR